MDYEVSLGFCLGGVFFGSIVFLGMLEVSAGDYKKGAIAAHEGRITCALVPQLSKPAEWQCVEVVSE